mmetsp:Transcript_73615/g.129948  ORF Transcript_73615/g.129948 Transcript_73615/m.129948 type:complete len:209 (-) Transcript_73615:1868-2494(-)
MLTSVKVLSDCRCSKKFSILLLPVLGDWQEQPAMLRRSRILPSTAPFPNMLKSSSSKALYPKSKTSMPLPVRSFKQSPAKGLSCPSLTSARPTFTRLGCLLISSQSATVVLPLMRMPLKSKCLRRPALVEMRSVADLIIAFTVSKLEFCAQSLKFSLKSALLKRPFWPSFSSSSIGTNDFSVSWELPWRSTAAMPFLHSSIFTTASRS